MIKKAFLILTFVLLIYATIFWQRFQGIAAGIAIILIGMMFLEKGFRNFAGTALEKIIKKTTNKLYKSIPVGIITTVLTQSSGLISVIAISFLSAGLLDLRSGIGIIFGANLGTTTGAWLISIFGLKIKISTFAIPMLVAGSVLLLSRTKKIRSIGYFLAGIGFLFLGISYLKESFETYKNGIELSRYAMSGFKGLVVYTLIGIIITVLTQSSHASLALILTALSAHQVTYINSLALAIGANIGTTIVAVIASINASADGKRLAAAHVLFKFVTAVISLVFMTQINFLVDFIASKVGIAAGDYLLKLSLFHTLFNTIGLAIMLPLVTPLEKLLILTIKEKPDPDIDVPKYISNLTSKYSTAALAASYKEARHLFENAFAIIAHSLNLHTADIRSTKKIKKFVNKSNAPMNINIDELYLKKVKGIYSKIIEFTTLAQENEISAAEIEKFHQIKLACRYIVEVIKGLKNLQSNMAKYIASENEEMRKQYNTFRIIIAKILREVYKAQSGEKLEKRREKLNKLLKKAMNNDLLLNGMLEKLIRQKLVTSEMATSLINDSSIIKFISKNLIKIAELLYLESDLNFLEENGEGEEEDKELLEEEDV